jgi:hypothetical protein
VVAVGNQVPVGLGLAVRVTVGVGVVVAVAVDVPVGLGLGEGEGLGGGVSVGAGVSVGVAATHRESLGHPPQQVPGDFRSKHVLASLMPLPANHSKHFALLYREDVRSHVSSPEGSSSGTSVGVELGEGTSPCAPTGPTPCVATMAKTSSKPNKIKITVLVFTISLLVPI